MNRRNFLRNTVAGSAPLFLGGMPIKTFASRSMIEMLSCAEYEDRILVMIFLNGGNDGLNTLVPMEQYDAYAAARPTLKLPENDVIDLDSNLDASEKIGLHPNLSFFKEIYRVSAYCVKVSAYCVRISISTIFVAMVTQKWDKSRCIPDVPREVKRVYILFVKI